MRKYTFFVTITLLIALFVPMTAEAVSFNPQLDIKSEAVYMVNLDTNTVVYSKNENALLSPASLTKIMTAGLLLEHFKDNPDALKTTFVSAPSVAFDEFVGVSVSTADFRINEKISYNDLLYGLLLKSACEAGNIIAYNIGGNSIQNFVKMMNDKAKELGCTNTNFTNAHGLYDETQRTSARDMVKITQWAMSLPKFMEIASTPQYTLQATEAHPQPRTIVHTMYQMMVGPGAYYYKYVKGIKTGTLDEAGQCLVSTASKDGYNYLIASMNAPIVPTGEKYNFLDHKALYEWAFSKLSTKSLINKDKEVGRVEVNYGKDSGFVLVKPAKEYSALWSSDVNIDSIKHVVKKEESVNAPVKEGDKLGVLELQYNGEVISQVDLVATKSVSRDNLKYYFAVAKLFPSSKFFKIAIFASLGIFLVYTILFVTIYSKRKRRRTFSVKRKR